MCLCRIGGFLPLYSISKTEVDVYVGETRRCNFMNSKGTTEALNTFHSPDPKLLISAAYHNRDSYEKSSHSLGMEQLVSSLHISYEWLKYWVISSLWQSAYLFAESKADLLGD